MGSDLEDDDALHSSSFLSPQMKEGIVEAAAVPPPEPAARSADAEKKEEEEADAPSGGGEREHEDADDDDDDDDDERPIAAPRARAVDPSPFGSELPSRAPSSVSMPPMVTPPPDPFAQARPPQQQQQQQFEPQHAAPPPPVDEYLRVSNKCRAGHCFRVQWETEVNPRCREKTALNVAGKIYLFDGFYILCHDDMPDVPQFEYTRDGVMCRIRFVREALPHGVLPPSEAGNPAISSLHGCHTMLELKRYLFNVLLGIQPMHLFQSVFGDPSSATGDVSDYCSDFHLIPRFISVSDVPLLNKDDLLAPHRIGFAVGKFLQIDHVLGCLGASTQFNVAKFLENNPARTMVDTVVSTRINGIPGLFRVDELVYGNVDEAPSSVDATGAGEQPVPKTPQLKYLKHAGRGAIEYDGVESRKKLRKWEDLGRLVQISPRVAPHEELLNPADCHLTGMRADIFEVGSAMPMVLKYIRHYKLLASFEADMKLQFKDKTLLRQAFTHGSYVDAAMQSVNTFEATISRVRLGHVFENTEALKRDRSAFLNEQSASTGPPGSKVMDAEMKRVTEQHLTTDFKPEFHSKYLCPYERLEFLGDAVLSFLVATSSFLKLPHSAGESVLHETRKDITNNAALGRVARDANFDVLMLTAYDLTQLKDEETSKIAADCMEALLGAVYTDQGIDACRRLLLELMDRFNPNVRELYLLDKDEVIEKATAYTEIDRDRFKQWEKEREMRMTHHRFTTKTNVVIRNTHLWVQTVTHGSFKAPQIDEGEFLCTDPSYERIEFLGDAVLQLLSSEFLVDALPNYQEHLLTQARSSLVKNTRLAVVARKAGYEEFLRLGNLVKQNGGLYTEDVLADVFEATLGAVFLENPRDLNKVRSILQQTLFPLLTEAIRRREWMNPEKKLSHYLGIWSRSTSSKMQCAFRKLPPQMGNEHCIAVFINGFRVAHGSGRTIHEAKNRACKKALYLYGVGLAK